MLLAGDDLDEVAETLSRARAAEAGPIRLVVPAPLTFDRWGVPSTGKAARLFSLCAASEPAHAVVLSSFAAHEPNHHHPGLVAEGFAPASRFDNSVTGAWRALEREARQAFSGRCPLAILRPSALAAWDEPNLLARLFGRRLAPVLPGYDPQVQLLDPDDLLHAVELARAKRLDGTYHVCPRGSIPLRAALRLTGRRPLAVPSAVSNLMRWTRLRSRWRSAHGRASARDELDFLRFPTTQSDDALRRLGYTPRWSSAQTVIRRFGARREGAEVAQESGEVDAPDFDDWGLSPRFVAGAGRSVLRFLRRFWFRADIGGLEGLPRAGPAVLVGTHRGFVPLDAMLVLDAAVRERGRWPRFLVHPGLLRWPWIAAIITRLGGVVACRENAERLLARGEVLGVFPEGLRGPFRLQREARRVGRFLSDDFVTWAARYNAPVVPFVALGPAETFPILAKIESRWWRRKTEWPFFPLTPTTPFLPIPMPVKWRLRFLEPIVVDTAEAATPDSRRVVCRRLRETLQRELDALYEQRRSVLLG